MSKLSFSNQDQCPSQCDKKYREIQEAVGIQKRVIDMVGRVINDTNDVIQDMSNRDFNSDLQKYQDMSQLARDLFNVFTKIPKSNRFIRKMMMKMMKDDVDDENNHRRRRPHFRPLTEDGDGGSATINPIEEQCSRESIEEIMGHSGILIYFLFAAQCLCSFKI